MHHVHVHGIKSGSWRLRGNERQAARDITNEEEGRLLD